MINVGLAMLTFILVILSFILVANKNFKYWAIIQALYGLSNYYNASMDGDKAGMMVSVAFMVMLRFSLDDAFGKGNIEIFNIRKFKLVFILYLLIVAIATFLNMKNFGLFRSTLESFMIALPVLFTTLLNHKMVIGWVLAYLYYFIISLLWFMEYAYEYSLVFSFGNLCLAAVCIYGFYKWVEFEREMIV